VARQSSDLLAWIESADIALGCGTQTHRGIEDVDVVAAGARPSSVKVGPEEG